MLEHQVEEGIDLCHKGVLLDKVGHRKHINPVASTIQTEITRAGIISFARFMELALYDCDHGYYRKSHIGKAGDFFTNVSVGPLFGQMLAYYLARELAPLPGEIQIAEAGANDGSLAADILRWLNTNRPEFAQRLTYYIVEPIPELQQRQRDKLSNTPRATVPTTPKIEWKTTLENLPQINGAILSNELLDAFPIHFFRWSKSQNDWQEIGVTMDKNSNFTFAPLPDAPTFDALSDLKPLEPYLPENFTVEFSPTAEAWAETAARKLTQGLFLASDYGDESTALWTPARAQGTLRAYRNHKLADNPLADPGEQDLTAHVNFTRIRAALQRAGLTVSPLQPQSTFLTNFAAEFLTNPTDRDIRQFQTLTHPDHLGRAFKLLLAKR
ncbi:MAG TPA: SAM-dependent methyltransferase [Verrucomicrobiae bacterium]|nr:SAM-dependent methyltransferase [Verrucomicrobiae bacterium]